MLEKITPEELVGKGVIGLADTPKLTAPEMQQKFEETARGVIIPKFNALIEALAAETGANEIGASDPVTGENVTVQRALKSLLKATVHTVVQDLTEDQKARARANIEAASATAVKALEEGKAPNSHAAQKETYGKGTGLLYGHVQLRDNPSEELDETKGAAATPKALHDAVAPLVSTEAQSTTEAQKAQARANIGAVNKEEAAAAGAAAVDEKYFDGVAEVMPETSVVCDEPLDRAQVPVIAALRARSILTVAGSMTKARKPLWYGTRILPVCRKWNARQATGCLSPAATGCTTATSICLTAADRTPVKTSCWRSAKAISSKATCTAAETKRSR